jgi:glycosyltransferase involved in cell wall biosynthesis
MRLLVTIPAQDEAPTIAAVVRQIPRDIPGIDQVEVIVVDDSSTDATAAEAKAAGAIVVPISGRPGLGPVWRLGMERAIRRGADLIVNLDGDGQFDSRDVARIIQPLLAGECDFVTCTRFAGGGPVGRMPLVKRWGNRAVTWMTNAVCGTSLSDVSCGFRAYNREAAYRLAQFGRWTYTEECIVYLVSRGLRIREIPFKVLGEREHGHSRVAGNVLYFASHLLHILVRAVRDGRPLKFFGMLSVVLGAPGIVLLAFLGFWYLSQGTTTPFTQFMTLGGVSVTLGLVVGVLALLADMVSRHRLIHEELLYMARCRAYGSAGVSTVEAGPKGAELATFFED